MKSFKNFLKERCWTGYKPVPGKKAYSKGSCVKEDGGAGGAGGAVGVGAVAGSGATSLPASQREPGVHLKKKKAHNPVMMGMARRTPPKI